MQVSLYLLLSFSMRGTGRLSGTPGDASLCVVCEQAGPKTKPITTRKDSINCIIVTPSQKQNQESCRISLLMPVTFAVRSLPGTGLQEHHARFWCDPI